MKTGTNVENTLVSSVQMKVNLDPNAENTFVSSLSMKIGNGAENKCWKLAPVCRFLPIRMKENQLEIIKK